MVVIEKFTNSHCGVCPNATLKIEEIIEKYPNTLWLMHHKPFPDNPMNNYESLALWDELNVPGVPYGIIDRIISHGDDYQRVLGTRIRRYKTLEALNDAYNELVKNIYPYYTEYKWFNVYETVKIKYLNNPKTTLKDTMAKSIKNWYKIITK